MNAWDDIEEDELRAEARQQRRENARYHHWCDVCHGHTGPGSPCAPEEPEPEESNDDED
jgi:cytochrome c5